MFKEQIRFTGKHAFLLKKYTKNTSAENPVNWELDNNEGEKISCFLFDTLIRCYMVAAMVGIINDRQVEEDKNDKEYTATIFADVLSKNRNELIRIFQHMVLKEANQDNVDSVIKVAFKVSMTPEESNEQQHKLENYVRGGLEIIDSYFSKCSSLEDVANTVFSLCDKLNTSSEIE